MTDQRMDEIMGNLLRAGVMTAAAVVLTGGIWYLLAAPARPDYRSFHANLRGFHALGTLSGPETLIMAGLLILVATPVARVVFSLAAFVMEGDRLYVAITAAVLAILLYSLGTAWL